MLHVVAFQSTFGAPQTTLANLAAVPDPSVRTSGNFIYMPPLSNLVGEYKIGQTITAAQLQAPSLKKLFNYDLSTLDAAAVPSSPVPYDPHFLSPYLLQPNEALQAFATDSAGVTADTIVVELSDGVVAPVSPVNALTISATFATTLLAGTWNNALLTFTQSLPVGTYNVIGARVECAGGYFARFYPVGAQYRPGVTVKQSVSDKDLPVERMGGKGIWFNFNQLTPPSIDVLGAAGAVTGVVYLDLVPAGQ